MECLSCGLTSKKFIETGLLGCSHCYPLFFNKKEVFSLTGANKFPKSRNTFKYTESLNKLYSLGISIRYRIARNFKNQYYGKPNERLIVYMDRFLQRPELLEFSKKGNIYTFDEDHIRAEYFYSPEKNLTFPDIFYNKDIFDFQYGFGYLTACPTNAGRGNKISLKIPFTRNSDENYEIFFKLFSDYIIINKYEPFFIIFIKNYNTSRFINFINIINDYLLDF